MLLLEQALCRGGTANLHNRRAARLLRLSRCSEVPRDRARL